MIAKIKNFLVYRFPPEFRHSSVDYIKEKVLNNLK